MSFAPSTVIFAHTSSPSRSVEYVMIAGCIMTSAIERAWRIAAMMSRVAPFTRAASWPERTPTTAAVAIIARMATTTIISMSVKALRIDGAAAERQSFPVDLFVTSLRMSSSPPNSPSGPALMTTKRLPFFSYLYSVPHGS